MAVDAYLLTKITLGALSDYINFDVVYVLMKNKFIQILNSC